jgi:hypothetical protein
LQFLCPENLDCMDYSGKIPSQLLVMCSKG